MSKFYLTTAIAYVNGAPHIGHALEAVQADAISRFKKMQGDSVFFLTGTDEHGIKVYEKALSVGKDPQIFVDEVAQKFVDIDEKLNVKYDDFIRTSSEKHKKGALEIWQILEKNGDIYLGSYEGKYCKGCEAYLTERDMDPDGNCAIHKAPPVSVKEENYFFKLSKYSDEIRKLIENDTIKILPESRKNEMLGIIGEEGLKDVSFSRPRSALPWGIPVPGDENHVMYVWCDALSNYITAIGLDSELWPADVHLIGKDILRFHAGIWIGMLLSAKFALPKTIAVHGFVTSRGEKMSKSLGNVVDPLEYLEKYGTDYLRYYLLREIPTLSDGDFSHDRFMEVANSELANNIGNLVNRVVMMTERFVGEIPEKVNDSDFELKIHDYYSNFVNAFNSFDIKKACEIALEVSNFANKFVDETKPWAMAKDLALKEDLSAVLYKLLELVRLIAYMLYPIVPQSAEKILVFLGESAENLGPYKYGEIKTGSKINAGEILFMRVEE
ncbi:MAG: methionine--tRNA ligase [Candidatus Gracilibacteria bacterium]|jgi:methionyl-tRNA synthetase|nr:methionine--tRNA ligase [Candidatus Gracilibacteria bacterium]